jgi:hypothetical protein
MVSSSEAPRASLSEEEVTVERTREGCSRTHRWEVEVQSGQPGAAERSETGVAASLIAGKADQGNLT